MIPFSTLENRRETWFIAYETLNPKQTNRAARLNNSFHWPSLRIFFIFVTHASGYEISEGCSPTAGLFVRPLRYARH